MISSIIFAQKMPRLVAEEFAESAKLEHLSSVAFPTFVALAKKVAKDEAIKANLPARRSAQSEGGRGLGYAG
jgi:hypothetical protein